MGKKKFDTAKKSETIPDELTFHYIKNPGYRSIHVDGAYGGLTPKGLVSMALYSERSPIPRQTSYLISDTLQLGEEIKEKRVSREGFIREVEINVMLDYNIALVLADWLKDKAEKAKKAIDDAQKIEQADKSKNRGK